ncbi:MAG: hypothetical protein ACJAYB_002616 [Psychromonas sp.]|jgi:hypothetical protein
MVWVWEWVAISFIQLRATAPPIAAKATDHRRRFLAKQFNGEYIVAPLTVVLLIGETSCYQ